MLERVQRQRGKPSPAVDLRLSDLACLPYTSGTTGPTKGSMSIHANVVITSQVYRQTSRMRPGKNMFAVAPLFHSTGLVGYMAAAILTFRFHPLTSAGAMAEHGATCTIGAMTVLIARTCADGVTPAQIGP